MADYQTMYLTLFRKVSTAITLLQEAQVQTEELYLSAEEPELRPFDTQPAGDDGEQ